MRRRLDVSAISIGLAAPLVRYALHGWLEAVADYYEEKENLIMDERVKFLEGVIDNALMRLEGDPADDDCPRCGAKIGLVEFHHDECPWSVASVIVSLRGALEGRAA